MYDESAPLTIPDSLTLEQAYCLEWYFQRGKDTPDHMCSFRELCAAMEQRRPHGFAAFNAASALIESYEPALLRFPDGKQGLNRHRLPLQVFAHPEILYRAINAAERRHNETIRAVTKHNQAVQAERDAGKTVGETQTLKRLPWPGVEVPLTEMPQGLKPTPVPQAAAPVERIRIGDIVPQPDGTFARLEEGPDGVPHLDRKSVV